MTNDSLIGRLQALKKRPKDGGEYTLQMMDHNAAISCCIDAIKGEPLANENPASLCNKPEHISDPVQAQTASMSHAAPVDAQDGGVSSEISVVDEALFDYSRLSSDELIAECKRLWTLNGRFMKDMDHYRSECHRLCEELLERGKKINALEATREPVLSGNGVDIPLTWGGSKLHSVIYMGPERVRVEVLAKEFYDAN
jgi:hypothetical protein